MRGSGFRSNGRERAELNGDDLHDGLRRGGADGALAAVERFPGSEELAADASLGFDPGNSAGKLFAGVVGGTVRQRRDERTGRTEHLVVGGTPVGFGDDRHACLIVPTRGGKSRSTLVPILLTYPANASVVAVDVKGDLASTVGLYRKRVLGQESVLFDPFEAASSSVSELRENARMNFLGGVDPDDADAVIDRADLVASSLVTRAPGEQDPHWSDTAQMAIEGVCAHVMTWPFHEDERDLVTVWRLLGQAASRPDEDTPSELEAAMRSNPAAGGAVMAAAADLFDKSEREFSSTMSTVRRHLHWLSYPRMQRIVRDGPFNLKSIQERPTAVYLSLPVRKLSSCSGWLRLMLNYLLAACEAGEARRAHQMGQGGHRTLVLIDEMPALGRMRSLEVAAGQCAGLGLKLLLVAQDLTQLRATYPGSWETFLSNSGTITMWGANDATTLEWIEKRLGQTTIVRHSRQDGSYNALVRDGASGRSMSLQSHPLMTSAEIARAFRREDPQQRQLVISAAHGPMILQRATYDGHPAFRALLDRVEGS